MNGSQLSEYKKICYDKSKSEKCVEMILSKKFVFPAHNSKILSISSLGEMIVKIEDLNKLNL